MIQSSVAVKNGSYYNGKYNKYNGFRRIVASNKEIFTLRVSFLHTTLLQVTIDP
ncbi:unnamed protein product [marine sediment metagenome]|uniref:Uncharacterized protein n=1 Tax=marine sediment metagenome TaxID=412755 RepID=X1RB11_9ZZZZ